jgi:hypothetical protein
MSQKRNNGSKESLKEGQPRQFQNISEKQSKKHKKELRQTLYHLSHSAIPQKLSSSAL